MKVLSVRVDDERHDQVERRRIEQGMSRTEWMRWAVNLGLEHAPPVPAPDPAATRFCLHPEGKVIGGFCVACSTTVTV